MKHVKALLLTLVVAAVVPASAASAPGGPPSHAKVFLLDAPALTTAEACTPSWGNGVTVAGVTLPALPPICISV